MEVMLCWGLQRSPWLVVIVVLEVSQLSNPSGTDVALWLRTFLPAVSILVTASLELREGFCL